MDRCEPVTLFDVTVPLIKKTIPGVTQSSIQSAQERVSPVAAKGGRFRSWSRQVQYR